MAKKKKGPHKKREQARKKRAPRGAVGGLSRDKASNPREVVQIRGYNRDGTLVEAVDIPRVAYYEESHPIVDDPGYLRKRGIVRTIADIFLPDGEHAQHMETTHSRTGKMTWIRVEFADGTVQEERF